MDSTTKRPAGMFVAAGPLYALRRAGQDVERRPAWYAALFDRVPGLGDEVAGLSLTWRARSRGIAMASLMAHRRPPQGLDPVAFLRSVGRDVGEHPDLWAHDLEASPDLARDLARFERALRASVAASAADEGPSSAT